MVEEPQALPTAMPTMTEAPMVERETPPTEAPIEAPTENPQPVATSRGPNLEATDPTTVSLNSGELQFVEFFRFT